MIVVSNGFAITTLVVLPGRTQTSNSNAESENRLVKTPTSKAKVTIAPSAKESRRRLLDIQAMTTSKTFAARY